MKENAEEGMSSLCSQDSEDMGWLEQEFERYKKRPDLEAFHDAHSSVSDNCVPDTNNAKTN